MQNTKVTAEYEINKFFSLKHEKIAFCVKVTILGKWKFDLCAKDILMSVKAIFPLLKLNNLKLDATSSSLGLLAT